MDVEKSIQRVREALQNTPQSELDAIYARVKAMNLKGPTLSELFQSQRAHSSYLPLHTKYYNA